MNIGYCCRSSYRQSATSIYLSMYNQTGDSLFIAGHVFKIVGYGFVLNGLMASTFSAFRQEAQLAARLGEQATRLQDTNHWLAVEVSERQKAEDGVAAGRTMN